MSERVDTELRAARALRAARNTTLSTPALNAIAALLEAVLPPEAFAAVDATEPERHLRSI